MRWKLWLTILLALIGVLAAAYAAYWFLRPPIQVLSGPAAREVKMDTGDTFWLVRVPVRVNRVDQTLNAADFSLAYVGEKGKDETPCYAVSVPGVQEFTPILETYPGQRHPEVTIHKPARFVLYFSVYRLPPKEASLRHKAQTVASFTIERSAPAEGK